MCNMTATYPTSLDLNPHAFGQSSVTALAVAAATTAAGDKMVYLVAVWE